MSQITLETPLNELEMHQRLRTRLTLCRIKTFESVMKINPREWIDVNPKVVNALKRFQASHAAIYQRLSGPGAPDSIDYTKARKQRRQASIADERRFFVANNLLSAYAQGGLLFRDDAAIDDVMEEIMTATSAFIDAYNKSINQPILGMQDEEFKQPNAEETAEEDIDDIEDMDEEPAPVEYHADLTAEETTEDDNAPGVAAPEEVEYEPKGDTSANHPFADGGEHITLTDYHGQRPSTSRLFKVGDTILVKAMKTHPNGKISVKAIVGNKLVQFDSEHYDWETAQSGNQQHHELHHLFSEI